MCDLRTFNRIEKAVEQRMAAGQMFTAFDITLDLQRKGVRRLHRDIRRDIKRVADDLIWRFGFERTLVSFRELGAGAFVYHPYGTDASLHQPSVRPQVKSRKRIPATRNVIQPGANQHQGDALCIPEELARVFGLSLAGEAESALDVVSGLFIIIKQRDSDVN